MKKKTGKRSPPPKPPSRCQKAQRTWRFDRGRIDASRGLIKHLAQKFGVRITNLDEMCDELQRCNDELARKCGVTLKRRNNDE